MSNCQNDSFEDEAAPPEEVELVVKFSQGCEAKTPGLIAEAFAALLAADLGLPIPEPFLVKIEQDFVGTLPDPEIKALAASSSPWAFGLRKLPPQFSTIIRQVSLPQPLLCTAAEIVAFDFLIANPDRRLKNPNCLFNGRALAIYDHELAFQTDGILFWRPPWEQGSINFAQGDDRHVFMDAVRGQQIDLSRLRGALESITPSRIEEYRTNLPADWQTELAAIRRMLAYIHQLRENAAAAITCISTALP